MICLSYTSVETQCSGNSQTLTERHVIHSRSS